MNRDALRRTFRELLNVAQAKYRDLDAALHIGKANQFPGHRDYAWCEDTAPVYRIVVSPKMLTASPERVRGVLMHEFGHAAFFLMGEPEHSEREADKLARAIFGIRIGYDEDDVQSIEPGLPARPRYLPNPGCCRGADGGRIAREPRLIRPRRPPR